MVNELLMEEKGDYLQIAAYENIWYEVWVALDIYLRNEEEVPLELVEFYNRLAKRISVNYTQSWMEMAEALLEERKELWQELGKM